MISGVYGLFSEETGVCLYVGQAKDITARWKKHLTHLRAGTHRQLGLVVFFRENGNDPSCIDWRILEEASDEYTRNILELTWFSLLKPEFYGKVPSRNEVWGLSEETKGKISTWSKMNRKKQVFLYSCHLCGRNFTSVKRNRKFCSMDCFRRNDTQHLTKAFLEDLYWDKNFTLSEIAKKVNVSHVTIANVMEKHGVPRRGRSSAASLKD